MPENNHQEATTRETKKARIQKESQKRKFEIDKENERDENGGKITDG